MISPGGLNQQLGGHTADPGTGRAQRPRVNKQKILSLLTDLSGGSQAGRARTDNDYVGTHPLPRLLAQLSIRKPTLMVTCQNWTSPF